MPSDWVAAELICFSPWGERRNAVTRMRPTGWLSVFDSTVPVISPPSPGGTWPLLLNAPAGAAESAPSAPRRTRSSRRNPGRRSRSAPEPVPFCPEPPCPAAPEPWCRLAKNEAGACLVMGSFANTFARPNRKIAAHTATIAARMSTVSRPRLMNGFCRSRTEVSRTRVKSPISSSSGCRVGGAMVPSPGPGASPSGPTVREFLGGGLDIHRGGRARRRGADRACRRLDDDGAVDLGAGEHPRPAQGQHDRSRAARLHPPHGWVEGDLGLPVRVGGREADVERDVAGVQQFEHEAARPAGAHDARAAGDPQAGTGRDLQVDVHIVRRGRRAVGDDLERQRMARRPDARVARARPWSPGPRSRGTAGASPARRRRTRSRCRAGWC